MLRRRRATSQTGSPNRQSGQALVEFSMVLIPFVLLLLGLVDLGRGVFYYNSVSEAAREVARAESVRYSGSSRAAAVISAQQNTLPDMSITIRCVTISGGASSRCGPGEFARVTATISFTAITPLLGELGPFVFRSVSQVEYS
jgi:Flp pilus assembly protein TadG